MSQVQAQNQSHEIGCSFPWSDVVSDTQRLNNDLLSLLGRFIIHQLQFFSFESILCVVAKHKFKIVF